jgi:hypothetical protein
MAINHKNKNSDTFRNIEIIKTYKYCIKCMKNLPEGSTDPWCDFSCRQEYFAEIRADRDDLYREWAGKD